MDKDTVLTQILNPKGSSTILGGETPVSVINNNKYISPVTSEAEGNSLPSLHNVILSALSGEVKTLSLVGPEGSGKTTALQKLVLDWAKGHTLQHFSHVFLFPLRELSHITQLLSLETLLLHHHGLIQPEDLPTILQKPEEVLFVFDDLHQCKDNLDPSDQPLCSNPAQEVSLSCLVASLLHGSLLKGAAFVAATRPTVSGTFPGVQVQVLGFLKPQREAFFEAFFADPGAAQKALQHMENTLGFYEISTSPRFCWTVCCIYKSLIDAAAKLPETLSQLCGEILVHLIQKLSLSEGSNRELVLALSMVASRCVLGEYSSCKKEEMDAFGFQQLLPSAGGFLQVDGESSGSPVFAFHSQLMQEFILAVSFFLDSSEGTEKMLEKHKGHFKYLDMFMSALSEQDQRRPLESLFGKFNSDQVQDFKRWFKSSSEETLKGYYKEKHQRCFHLLHQAQNESLVKEILKTPARIGISYGDLSLQDCGALNYVMTTLGRRDNLNLYSMKNLTEDMAERLAPTVSLARTITLSQSSLSAGAVSHLASAISRGITEELDLSHSCIRDEKFKLLCAGLRDCKMLRLILLDCKLTEASCEDLVSVLTSVTSQLRVLDLRFNEIGDQGLMKLSSALHSPHCKLQELLLRGCGLTAASLEALSAALCSAHSEMRKVELMHNTIGDSGVEALCKSLQHPHCKVQSLVFFDCELTGACCPHLKEAMMSEYCCLAELDLAVNDLGQEGALLLCDALSRPGCPMKKLSLNRCELTETVFRELGSVLKNGTTKLKSLGVGLNNVGDKGVKHLWDAMKHPSCMLEDLDVEMTDLTDACLEDLCAAVRASNTLKNLELRNNQLTDASVPALVQVMLDKPNVLEMCLKYNDFSEDVFELMDECDRIRY